MNTKEKIKKMFLIALGFGLATYFIMSGFAMLNQESDVPSEVHSDTMK